MKPIIVGIVGPSCSGKSTIVKEILKSNPNIVRLKLDNYWNDEKTFPKTHGYTNWERPENLNLELLYKNIKELHQGKPTKVPICKKMQFNHFETFEINLIIIVEGFLLFYDKRITNLLDLKIYVDIPEELIIKRNINRSRAGWSEDRYKIVVEEYRQHIAPFKKQSDIILDGTKSIKTNTELILAEINKKL
jgi:uridine kinase